MPTDYHFHSYDNPGWKQTVQWNDMEWENKEKDERKTNNQENRIICEIICQYSIYEKKQKKTIKKKLQRNDLDKF